MRTDCAVQGQTWNGRDIAEVRHWLQSALHRESRVSEIKRCQRPNEQLLLEWGRLQRTSVVLVVGGTDTVEIGWTCLRRMGDELRRRKVDIHAQSLVQIAFGSEEITRN